jgi:predicted nucleic acid-binding Zn ribbon protein
MPLFDLECKNCEITIVKLLNRGEEAICMECKQPLVRLVSAAAFTGSSGFYHPQMSVTTRDKDKGK